MSRYRRSDMEFDYSSGPPPAPQPQSQRWDASRFSRESQYRTAPVIEERPPYQPPPRRAGTYYDEEQDYYERDTRDSRGDFRERKYFEEDDYYDPRSGSGAMVPFKPDRPARPSAPPRPAMMRRQSSVDRFEFDRRSSRRQYDDYRPPPPPPPPQQEYRRSRQDSRPYYDDVRVQDPDYYGDDGFREYREREWIRTRSRNDSPSPDRRAPTAASIHSSHRSEFIDAAPPEVVNEHFSEHIVEEEKVVEKPYPRRGKTRMPKRLVHTRVLFDLGYPFYEEDEKTILIQKALGPENIDEVFSKSKEMFERQTITTTQLIEAPPSRMSVAPPPPLSIHESIHIKPISEAPRSVREWDNIVERSPSPGSSVSQATRKSGRRSKSQAGRRDSFHESVHASIHVDDRRSIAPSRVSRAPDRRESLHEAIHIDERRSISPARTVRTARPSSRRQSVHESFHEDIHIDEHRDVSPARTARSARSRRSRSHAASRRSRSSSASGTAIIERRRTVIEEGPILPMEQSNNLDIGPLSLIPSRASKRTDADIEAEIRRLEIERRDVRRDTETVRYENRVRRDSDPLRLGTLRSPSPRGEIIVADRTTGEDIRVRKDKRAARSRSRPPGPGLLKSMMYTVT